MRVKVTEKQVMITELDPIIQGEFGINRCDFSLPESFDGLSVTAIFNGIPVPLTDGKCIIPALKNGNCIFGVYAYRKNGEDMELMYSPKPTMFFVEKGSYCEDVNEEIIPEVFDYEIYCRMLQGYWRELFGENTLTQYKGNANEHQFYSAKAVNDMLTDIAERFDTTFNGLATTTELENLKKELQGDLETVSAMVGSEPETLTIVERADAVFDWSTSNGVVRYVQQEDVIDSFPLLIAGGTYRVTLDGVTKEFVMLKKAEVNSNRDNYEFQLGNMAVESGEGDEGDYYITFLDNGDDIHFEFGIKSTDDIHSFKIEYIDKGAISLVSSLDDLVLIDETAPEYGYYVKTIKLLISSDLNYALRITLNGSSVDETIKQDTFTVEGDTMTIKYFGNMGLMGMGDDTGEQYLIVVIGGYMQIMFSPEITVTEFKLDFLGISGGAE